MAAGVKGRVGGAGRSGACGLPGRNGDRGDPGPRGPKGQQTDLLSGPNLSQTPYCDQQSIDQYSLVILTGDINQGFPNFTVSLYFIFIFLNANKKCFD